MTKKYSSFKDQQKITESFRTFIGENEPPLKSYGTPRRSETDRLTVPAGSTTDPMGPPVIRPAYAKFLSNHEADIAKMNDKEKKVWRWVNRIKNSKEFTGFTSWNSNPENLRVRDIMHDETTADEITLIKQVLEHPDSYPGMRKAQKTKTESKVRFTKSQLHKIIKEEIKNALLKNKPRK